MDRPTVFEHYALTPDLEVLPGYFPIPVLGLLPVNSFLIRAAEPVLVDTGVAVLSDDFMDQLTKAVDLDDLRWIWLTHTDQDHIGSLQRLLDSAPHLRVITSFLATGKMSLFNPLPMDRLFFINPGQSINVGDRTLTALRPPTYDAPETTGCFDNKSGILFSADSFGALMSEPAAVAADIGPERLKEGLITWTTVDSPWLHQVDTGKWAKTLEAIRVLAPKVILSSHLPPALGMHEVLLKYLMAVPDAAPFVGPDQQALEAMLRGA